MGASEGFHTLAAIYGRSKSWKEAFKRSPNTACRAASTNSLCAAGDEDSEAYAQLIVATSPLAYSSADPGSTGGHVFVGEARDQRPCASCTGFAVAAAAQAAIATALQKNASEVEPFSPQDLMYCSEGSPTSCTAGWTLPDVLKQLTQRRIAPEVCLPYQPPPLDSQAAKPPATCGSEGCAGDASSASVAARQHMLASQGTFTFQSLFDENAVARHIREHGAVISRFDLMDDFRPFFDDPDNAKRVYSPSPAAKVVETHAVTIVGYNMTEGSWLCLNSWGPKFGDRGLFRVAMGKCKIAAPPDTYGVIWQPLAAAGPVVADLRQQLKPSMRRGGCFEYTARPGDFLSGVALDFSVPLQNLLLDNIDVIGDLDFPIAGKTLVICGMRQPLDMTVARIKAAAAKQKVGMSLGTASYMAYYGAGALAGLQEAGVYTPKTKISGFSTHAHCTLCGGRTVQQLVTDLDGFRSYCSTRMLCILGAFDVAVNTYAVKVYPPAAADTCNGICYTGLTAFNTRKPQDPDKYYDVGTFTGPDDFYAALAAGMFMPVVSGGKSVVSYRGVDTVMGYWGGMTQPPCPPGVEYCLRVVGAPAPALNPEANMELGLRLMSFISQRKSNTSLDDLFGPGGAAKAAAILAYEPTPAQLRAAGEAALELRVDIAPNIYTPLGESLNPRAWQDMVAIFPDDDAAAFLYKLGLKDAGLWARLTGYKRRHLSGNRRLLAG